MHKIEAQNIDTTYSVTARIWHWANALLISLLLMTILVSSLFFDKSVNTGKIQVAIAKKDGLVTTEQAKYAARALGKYVWEWHTYLGYALAAFFVLRIVVELVSHKETRLLSKLKMALFLKKNSPSDKALNHLFWVKMTYSVFYVLLFVVVVTGLSLALDNFIKPLEVVKKPFKKIHEVSMYLVIAFYAIHLVGVVLAEIGKTPGIVSKMINGKN